MLVERLKWLGTLIVVELPIWLAWKQVAKDMPHWSQWAIVGAVVVAFLPAFPYAWPQPMGLMHESGLWLTPWVDRFAQITVPFRLTDRPPSPVRLLQHAASPCDAYVPKRCFINAIPSRYTARTAAAASLSPAPSGRNEPTQSSLHLFSPRGFNEIVA